MPPLSETVKHLIIINVLVFVAFMFPISFSFPDFRLFWPGYTDYFKPYQLVTHMFHHASPRHLLFNMFGLYIFGSIVEYSKGNRKFLLLYLLSGIGSLLLHIAIQYYMHFYQGVNSFAPALGASGAVMGVVMAYAVLFPERKLNLIFPPISIKAMYVALIFVAIDLFGGFSGVQNGIANWAHLGGAATGLFIGWLWTKR